MTTIEQRILLEDKGKKELDTASQRFLYCWATAAEAYGVAHACQRSTGLDDIGLCPKHRKEIIGDE
jgi:hypothetical protein